VNGYEQAMKKAYNIHFLKYESGNHQELLEASKELAESVMQFRMSNPQ
jgi:hypothetical protein